ncbi:holin [Pectobacterium polaris]|uniref:HP1 family phage holin n=1 Tax=Pectobacterium polaris TaxID=2042057 RepID=UPI000D6107EF|nr:HP1 family phage holin [Pectobacterium polaris]MCU1787737.1 holin [Pectobacterium polaris]PWD54868.1 holin [Pectobacterium polaris]
MTKMSTIYSRLSYGTGTTLTGCGVSAKAYAATTDSAWLIEKIAGLTLSDWAIIVGIACTVVTCGVNWHYRRKEYQLNSRRSAG